MNLFGQKVTIRQTDGHGINANLVCRGEYNYGILCFLFKKITFTEFLMIMQ